MKGLRPYLNCISPETEWTLQAINGTASTERKIEEERDGRQNVTQKERKEQGEIKVKKRGEKNKHRLKGGEWTLYRMLKGKGTGKRKEEEETTQKTMLDNLLLLTKHFEDKKKRAVPSPLLED